MKILGWLTSAIDWTKRQFKHVKMIQAAIRALELFRDEVKEIYTDTNEQKEQENE